MNPARELFPEEVRPMLDSAYWRVLVRPSQHDTERVPYAKLREVLDHVQVRLRGWYFPHLSNKTAEIQHGKNYYATWVVFDNYEYWRFYQSAQLVHYHGVREQVDQSYREHIEKLTRQNLGWTNPDWSRVNGFIDIINFVYTVTEVFEFASRLAAYLHLGDSMDVEIGLRNIEGYVLGVSDFARSWDFFYRCDSSELSRLWVVDSNDLKAGSASFSLAAVQWFFERFGWANVNMRSLEDAQRPFLKNQPGF